MTESNRVVISAKMAFVSSFAGAQVRPAVHVSRTVCVRPVCAHSVTTRRSVASMSLVPVVASDAVPSTVVDALTLAAREGDFGGYLFPIVGLLSIVVIIALLKPPVKE